MDIARLKELRIQEHLTQKELASLLHLDYKRYNHYETGRSEPDNDMLLSISDFFGVTTDYLLGREPLDAKKDGPPSEEDEPPVDDPVIAQIMDVVRQMSPEERRLYLENLKTLRLLQEQGRKPDIQE